MQTRPPVPDSAGTVTAVQLGAEATPAADAEGPGTAHTNLPVVTLVLGIAAVTLGVTVVWYLAAIVIGLAAVTSAVIARRRAPLTAGGHPDTRTTVGAVLGTIAIALGVGAAVRSGPATPTCARRCRTSGSSTTT